MKITEIIERLDTKEESFDFQWEEDFLQEFDLYPGDIDILEGAVDNPFTEKSIYSWLCTDDIVGYYAIYFKGEFVGISRQLGRKCDREFYWLSSEVFHKVKDYILSLISKEKEYSFSTLNPNEEWEPFYQIEFYDQLLDETRAVYKGEEVDVHVSESRNMRGYLQKTVLITYNNDKVEVELSELKFPIKLKTI
jgi:hypothetical protein